ncbi:hypothetical protein BCV69DRAFT_277113 [Microstroma glucosiphilum]|uniref:Uncharacterized protein n=1 Tax=Pseudomicrostroma glucosiphilum TaxID=1684307 RepID=A0A316U6T0_9BASI|nr:hypothetical protein BCV69DRAFT_277113 [Pseudomicrostroma glucosiphilum]PWN20987.1 hypothetical protein BCV69DRAFT_277113 [Pseudomicrostroma glucosiphilum]
MAKLPSDSKIESYVRQLLEKDVKANKGKEITIRVALAEHFDVDVDDLKEEKKVVIKAAVDKAVEELLPDEGGEQSEEEVAAEETEHVESPALDSGMSSLDDSDVGEGSSTGAKKKQGRKSKEGGKQSTSSRSGAKTSKKKESSASGDKTEEEIARLKKLVVACGVRKQWSSWFAKESATTSKDQARALRSLLSELGMDGRLSMEKAKKIKEEREFAEELKAIGADTGAQERESRGSRSGLQRKRLGGSAESSEDESEEEEPQRAAKKSRLGASLAAFAAELNSDDE